MRDADETVNIPPKAVQEGSQDWHLLATEGHVRGHRLVHVAKVLFLPCVLSGLIGVGLIYASVSGKGGASFTLPEAAREWLVPNPDTYAVIPGREAEGGVPYTFAWLASAAGSPQRGLTAQAWSLLLEAATADVREHGDNVEGYTSIPETQGINPKLTRPERALAEFRGDLARGIVAVPSSDAPRRDVNGQPVIGYVAAWVEGKWSFAVILGAPSARWQRDQVCLVIWPAEGACREGGISSFMAALRPNQGGGSNVR